MYDFSYPINDNQRFNIYGSLQEVSIESDFYQKIRNTLSIVVITLVVFMAGVFSLKTYQQYQYEKSMMVKTIHSPTKEYPIEVTHLELTKAITNSVVKSLQSKYPTKMLNDQEIKHIIKKVVTKIEIDPAQVKQTQN
jgi:hypothetical protein